MSKKRKTFTNQELNIISTRFADARKQKSKEMGFDENGLSYRELAKMLNIGSHTTIQKIEKTTQEPSYEVLRAYMKEFGGSFNYWLGQDKCKELSNQEIHSKTGLSEKAIEVLKNNVPKSGIISLNSDKMQMLNYIIENLNHSDFLENMRKYLYYSDFAFSETHNSDNAKAATDSEPKIEYARQSTRIVSKNKGCYLSAFTLNASDIPKIFHTKIVENIAEMKVQIEKEETEKSTKNKNSKNGRGNNL